MWRVLTHVAPLWPRFERVALYNRELVDFRAAKEAKRQAQAQG